MPAGRSAEVLRTAASPPVPDAGARGHRDEHAGHAASRVIETCGSEAAREVLASTYGPMRIDARGPRRGMRLERAALGAVELHRLTLAMDFDAVGTLPRNLVFGQLTSGRLRLASAGSDRHYLPGGVFLAGQPGHAYSSTVHEADLRLAVIDPALPGEIAGTAPGRVEATVRFTGCDAVSPEAASRWAVTVAYLRDQLLSNPEAAEAPLVTASAARLLVATALVTFPNNALTDPTCQDGRDGSTATLRRAVAFIDEHAHENIALADIAAHSRVTIRAVQLAFRRHLDTTPTRYLRKVRLDRAHRQLQAGDAEGESVTAVCYQWGFASPSRFAAYYRSAFGVPPSSTLRA